MNEDFNLQGNEEINKALKEFETKARAEQAQESPEVPKTSDVPKIVQLVMKWFKIKEQQTAEYVLLGFCIVAIGVSLYLFFGGSITKNKFSIFQEDLTNVEKANLPKEVLDSIPFRNAK